jgi:hypothetical protein
LTKDYDVGIHYHPGKANMVAHALSRKVYSTIAMLQEAQPTLCEEFQCLNLRFVADLEAVTMEVKPTLDEDNRKGQAEDENIKGIKANIKARKAPKFLEDEKGMVWFGKRIYVPDQRDLKEIILREAHELAYSIHPGNTKMYQDLKDRY